MSVRLPLHPAVPIAGWLALALCVQWLPSSLLLAVAVLFGGLLWQRDAASFRMTLRRLRWLLLALLAVMGWTLPGQALWEANWAPTRQGLLEGALHGLRLLVLVWAIRGLWLTLTRGELLAGLFALARPLARLGLPTKRMMLRLWLTLDYADALLAAPPRFSLAAWRTLLSDNMAKPGPDTVELPFYPWRRRDSALVLVAAATVAGVFGVWG
ncbi:hypothetical protein OL229_00520 [Neisseriaceae bacterium JH1-16]|nr:hypothetical protein [Neisseriaceae bacterium JH1-16]